MLSSVGTVFLLELTLVCFRICTSPPNYSKSRLRIKQDGSRLEKSIIRTR